MLVKSPAVAEVAIAGVADVEWGERARRLRRRRLIATPPPRQLEETTPSSRHARPRCLCCAESAGVKRAAATHRARQEPPRHALSEVTGESTSPMSQVPTSANTAVNFVDYGTAGARKPLWPLAASQESARYLISIGYAACHCGATSWRTSRSKTRRPPQYRTFQVHLDSCRS